MRAAVVAAIEQDDFGPSGGPAYARGHVRMIARQLGLDSVAIVAMFDRQVAGFDSGPIAESLVRHNAYEPELATQSGVRWGRLVTLLVLMAAVAAGAVWLGHWIVAGR